MAPRRRQMTYSKRPNHAARSAHARGAREFRTYDTSVIRPKQSKAPKIVAAVLLVAIALGVFFGVTAALKGCSSDSANLLAEGQTVEITVAEGSGASAIGQQLQEAGLVAKASDFTSRVTALEAESSLKPGTYTLTGGMEVDEIVKLMQQGAGATGASLTIPEGFTLEGTAQRVAEVTGGKVTAEAFTQAASDASAYAAEFPFLADAGTSSLEGFLFPKTYAVGDSATAETIIRMMLAQYQAEVVALDYSYAQSQGLSTYDVLKLASIIEKESTSDTRGTVSSVFYNRMSIDMPLQSDATTAYEVGHDPTWEETHADTPYSTYTNNGLTPTPICSPGIESLKAACSPEQTDYYYFYFKADENGEMQYYFSRTNDEHNAAVFS